MATQYPMLTYRGRLSPDSTEGRLAPGRVLGHLQVGPYRQYWEILDSEIVDDCGVSDHEGFGEHTHVFLQAARTASVQAETELANTEMKAMIDKIANSPWMMAAHHDARLT